MTTISEPKNADVKAGAFDALKSAMKNVDEKELKDGFAQPPMTTRVTPPPTMTKVPEAGLDVKDGYKLNQYLGEKDEEVGTKATSETDRLQSENGRILDEIERLMRSLAKNNAQIALLTTADQSRRIAARMVSFGVESARQSLAK